jgi:hypothetical protein
MLCCLRHGWTLDSFTYTLVQLFNSFFKLLYQYIVCQILRKHCNVSAGTHFLLEKASLLGLVLQNYNKLLQLPH